MEKRTHAQLFRKVRSDLDVSATPYFSDAEIAEALTTEYAEWLTSVAPMAETDERIRRDLGALITTSPAKVPLNGKIDLNALNPRPYRVLSVMPTYLGCAGTRAAIPLSFDARRSAERDPYNAPIQIEPAYLDWGGMVEVLPTPQSVVVVYIARPKPILATEPMGKTEVEYEVQSILIERTAAKLAIPSANADAYSAFSAEYQKSELS